MSNLNAQTVNPVSGILSFPATPVSITFGDYKQHRHGLVGCCNDDWERAA